MCVSGLGQPSSCAQPLLAPILSCLEKWHAIPIGHHLTADQRDHVIAVLQLWLETQPRKQARDLARTRL
jgi:hypothetical protein